MDHSLYGYLQRRTDEELKRMLEIFIDEKSYSECTCIIKEILQMRTLELLNDKDMDG